jgi:hypothetical protein
MITWNKCVYNDLQYEYYYFNDETSLAKDGELYYLSLGYVANKAGNQEEIRLYVPFQAYILKHGYRFMWILKQEFEEKAEVI